jgi:hypothetical protein
MGYILIGFVHATRTCARADHAYICRAQPDVGCFNDEDLSTLTILECNLICQHFDWSNSPCDTIASVFTMKTSHVCVFMIKCDDI